MSETQHYRFDPGAYVAQPVKIVVSSLPTQMEESLKDTITQIMEQAVHGVQGLRGGLKVVTGDDGRLISQSPAMDVTLRLSERKDKIVNRAFTAWIQQHVVGKTIEEIRSDGAGIYFIELDESGKVVLDAWLIHGAYPGNSGLALVGQSGIGTDGAATSQEYRIDLQGVLENTDAVRRSAQAHIDRLSTK